MEKVGVEVSYPVTADVEVNIKKLSADERAVSSSSKQRNGSVDKQ